MGNTRTFKATFYCDDNPPVTTLVQGDVMKLPLVMAGFALIPVFCHHPEELQLDHVIVEKTPDRRIVVKFGTDHQEDRIETEPDVASLEPNGWSKVEAGSDEN